MKKSRAMIASPTRPPTTPPTMAPMFELFDESELVELDDDVAAGTIAVAGSVRPPERDDSAVESIEVVGLAVANAPLPLNMIEGET